MKVQKRLKGTKIKVWNSYHPETITVNKNLINYQVKKKKQEFYSSPTEAHSLGSRFSESSENWPTC